MKQIIISLIGIGFIVGALFMTIIFLIGLKIEDLIERRKTND
jgi:hypothetical protein